MKKIKTTNSKQELLNKMCATDRERLSFLEKSKTEDLSVYFPSCSFEVRMTLKDQKKSSYFSKTR